MGLQDWASFRHIVRLGCTMSFQGCRQKSPLGLADGDFEGGQQCHTGPSPMFKRRGRLLAEFTAGDMLGSTGLGGKKGE